MPRAGIQKADNVFVNCPFDSAYEPLLDAIVFTVFDCGFVARCAKEVADSSAVRIDKIQRIIEECKYGIHDISRVELNENNLPRFNMPLELGLFLGAKRFGAEKQKDKSCLILDAEKFRYQEFISEIAGQDIEDHGGDFEKCISRVRKWLNDQSGRKTLPGRKLIVRRYHEFREDFPKICKEAAIEEDEVSFNDLAQFISEWLRNR